MPAENPSASVENFLKTVYVLQQQSDDRVSTNALAEALAIAPPSVTDMARRMVSADLVDYERYHGVRLTKQGEAIALKVLRRHRLIELYLVQELGYDLHEVHEDAEVMEHAVSDRFMEAIDLKLGHPQLDPHGDPIPSSEGVVRRRNLIPLTDLAIGESASVSRLISENNAILQHILDKGFTLGARIQVIARDPFDGPLTTQINGAQQVVGHNVATCILVEVLDDAETV